MDLTINKEPGNCKFDEYCCAVDLGGTNLRIAIFGKSQKLEPIFMAKTTSDKGFSEQINAVLQIAREKYGVLIRTCAAGIAGPLSEDRKTVKLTNIKLTLEQRTVLKKTKLAKFTFLNDLEAVAWGLLAVGKESILELTPGVKPARFGAKAIIAAGTGLGEAILIHTGKTYQIVASEGGHSLLAGVTDEQQRIIKYIQTKINQAPEYESAVSGNGLGRIYSYYSGKTLLPEQISRKAITRKDQNCVNAMKTFMQFYAQECHNLAYKVKATGGVYIAGNIAASNLEFFEDSSFIKSILSLKEPKHPMLALLKKIPFYVIRNPDINLYGAANAALQ